MFPKVWYFYIFGFCIHQISLSCSHGRVRRRCAPEIYVLSGIRPWSQRWDSNPQPTDYKSVALPIALRWQNPDTSQRSIRHTSERYSAPFGPPSLPVVNIHVHDILSVMVGIEQQTAGV